MNKCIVFTIVVISFLSGSVFDTKAETYIVENTKLYVYAQSPTDSEAHFVRSSAGIYQGGEHPWCGNRAYIDFSDKEIFAMALSTSLANKSVNFMYEDAAASKEIVGHAMSKCRILSIWQ